MLGVISGVAGGMIRDLLTGEIPLVLRTGDYLDATAALCGASTFVVIAPRKSSLLAGESIAWLLFSAFGWRQ